MNEERLYDYSKGLNAPYWIQEIKTKRALDYGTLRHLCSCPFHCFIIVFVAMLLFGGFIFVPLAKSLTQFLSCSIGIFPNKLAKFYTEYEPHGKEDARLYWRLPAVYFWDFKINKKAIYHEDQNRACRRNCL